MGRIIKEMVAVGKDGRDVRLKVLFDSGASFSSISPEAAEKVGSAKIAGGFSYELTMADGSVQRTDRMSLLTIKANGDGCVIPIPSPVLPGQQMDLILGANDMQTFEMSLHPVTHKVVIGKRRIEV